MRDDDVPPQSSSGKRDIMQNAEAAAAAEAEAASP